MTIIVWELMVFSFLLGNNLPKIERSNISYIRRAALPITTIWTASQWFDWKSHTRIASHLPFPRTAHYSHALCSILASSVPPGSQLGCLPHRLRQECAPGLRWARLRWRCMVVLWVVALSYDMMWCWLPRSTYLGRGRSDRIIGARLCWKRIIHVCI